MNGYSKYFLQHSLWLDDGFCQYYVQDPAWGRQQILDVELVIFDWIADAGRWIDQCRAYDEVTTQHRLRSYLAHHCGEPYNLHRMSDSQVVGEAARQLCRHVHPVVIHPRMGWAVQVDEHTAAPVLPVCVEPEPELAALIAELKGDLNALVAEQQKKYDQYEAELAKLSPEQRALLYGKRAGGSVYDTVIGDTWDMIKAAPGAIWKAAKAFPGFYAGYLKGLWKVAQLPSQMAALTGQAMATGNYNPLKKEIDQIVTPVAQTYEQATKYKSMLTLLLSNQQTYELLYDFAQRYWAATHPIERTQMAASAVSDIVVTVILAIVTAGIGAAANVASKSGRLVKVAKLLEKIAMTIKKISPETKLLDKAKEAAGKVRKTEKRAAKAAREAREVRSAVKGTERAEKLEKKAAKEYDAAEKVGGPKKTEDPRKAIKKIPKYNNTQPMASKYVGEETGSVWGSKVKYLSEAEREKYKLTIKDGRLYDSAGELFDTKAASSVFPDGGGKAIFVMDEYGDIYASKIQAVGEFHHSSFLAGKPVAAAGEISIEKGVVKEITRRSGHYMPSEKHLNQFVAELGSQGVNTETVKIGSGF